MALVAEYQAMVEQPAPGEWNLTCTLFWTKLHPVQVVQMLPVLSQYQCTVLTMPHPDDTMTVQASYCQTRRTYLECRADESAMVNLLLALLRLD